MCKAVVTDIQRFSIHDGPGIRTIVFFKGCPLHCKWCQNPETWEKTPEIMQRKELCIGCGTCLKKCLQNALSATSSGIFLDRNKCIRCGMCADQCYAEALTVVGTYQSKEEIMKEVLCDRTFYEESGGGLTLSGGEVTMYPDFASELLHMAQNECIHTAIETCGYCRWEDLERILRYTDLVLFDIKIVDRDKFEKYIGGSSRIVLQNLQRICRMRKPVILRFPLIPGVNDDSDSLEQICMVAKENNLQQLHIMPFHQVGSAKWKGIDRNYAFEDHALPTDDNIENARCFFETHGLTVCIGGAG